MLRILSVLLFCAGIFCLAQSHAQVTQTGAGLGAPASSASASYAYLGNYSTGMVGASGASVPMTMTGNAGLLILAFGVQSGLTGTAPTAVYDPTGANVSLSVILNDPNNTAYGGVVLFAGVVPGATGSKNILVTGGGSGSGSFTFQRADAFAWLASNLLSTTPQSTVVTVASAQSLTLNTLSGEFMFGAAWSVSSPTFDFQPGTTTVAPSNINTVSSTFAAGADWSGNGAGDPGNNSPFTVKPAGAFTQQVWATYH